jgi:hypothetical protein
MAKKSILDFSSKIYKLPHLLGMHYIEIPYDVVQHLGGKFNVRLVCSINKKLKFQGGIVALGNGNGYISINNKRLKQLGVAFGDTVSVSLKKDESEFGMPVPEELQELLKQDDEAKRRFDLLSKGKQRYIIYYVSQVKNSQLRIERALLLLTNLKKSKEGKESFRQMLGLE